MNKKFWLSSIGIIFIVVASSFFLLSTDAPSASINQSFTRKNSAETAPYQLPVVREAQGSECTGGAAFNPFSNATKLGECRTNKEVNLEVNEEKTDTAVNSFANDYLPKVEKVQSLLERFNRGDLLAAADILTHQDRCVVWGHASVTSAIYPCELLSANADKAKTHLEKMAENRHPDALFGLAMLKASPILLPDNSDSQEMEALMDIAIGAGSGHAAAERESSQRMLRNLQEY